MPQTFYVTQDEEILSLVGRLRSSALLENVFVVPNRALILQSAVNLRILRREADKLGKVVTIVTQDDMGRALAEKAGILTRPYSEEARHENEGASPILPTRLPVDVSIGSSDFFAAPPKENAPVEEAPLMAIRPSAPARPVAPASPMPLRVRDATPKNLTALNSTLHAEAQVIRPGTVQESGFRPIPQNAVPGSGAAPVRRPENMPPQDREVASGHPGVPRAVPAYPTQTAPVSESARHVSAERLARMYRKTDPSAPAGPKSASANQRQANAGNVGGKSWVWFSLFAGISLLSLLGVGIYVFLPKAEITVVPHSISKSLEMEFNGKKNAADGDREIPIRIVEREDEVSVSIETSGTSAGNGTKARGVIIISNAYGSDPQPLVATTRFEAENGKVFRLAKGVTVPGVSEVNGKEEPGVIEADVIADEAGEAYNIGTSSFSIPGFKGNPKYDKITAKSKESMTGGSSVGDAGAKTVSEDDIVRAKEAVENRFRSMSEESFRGALAEGETFLPDSVEISPVGTPSHPQAGVAASSFEYKARYKARFFVFSESALKEKASFVLRRGAGLDDTYETRDISLEYGEASSDFDGGIMYIKVRATALFASHIDIGGLRNDFLGKDTDGIKEVLEKHTEVKKIEVSLKPKLFIVSVPNDPDRVTIIVEKP